MPEAKNKAKNKKTGIRKNPKSAAMPKKSKPGVQKKPEIKAIPKDSGLNVHKTRIKVLGIGGGAGAILSDISLKIKRADFILAGRAAAKYHAGRAKRLKNAVAGISAGTTLSLASV